MFWTSTGFILTPFRMGGAKQPTAPLQKNWFFWSNPYKIEVMITSLIEMLELPNFGHMATCTI